MTAVPISFPAFLVSNKPGDGDAQLAVRELGELAAADLPPGEDEYRSAVLYASIRGSWRRGLTRERRRRGPSTYHRDLRELGLEEVDVLDRARIGAVEQGIKHAPLSDQETPVAHFFVATADAQ